MKNALTFGIFASILLASCQSSTNTDVAVVKENSMVATISGYVKNEKGAPLSGVKVTSPDTVVFTDSRGLYSLPAVASADRYVLKLEKDSFFYHISSKLWTDTATTIVSMVPKSNTSYSSVTTFSSEKGVEVKVDGCTISIPANSLALPDGSSYNGNVNLSVVYLNPENRLFDELVPGGDLCAIRSNGDTATLVSYGMARVEMESENGEKLQLSLDSKAKLTFPVSSFQKNNPHDTIPLWWFDEKDGIWREEGVAFNKGDYYEGYVNHFTWWNCDHYFKNGARVRLFFLDDKGEVFETDYAIEFGNDNGIWGRSKSCSVPAKKELRIRICLDYGLLSDVVMVVPPLEKGERRDVYVKSSLRKVNVKLVDEKGVQLMYEPISIGNEPGSWVIDGNGGYFFYLKKGNTVSIKVPRFSINRELNSDMVDDSGVYKIVCSKKACAEKLKNTTVKSDTVSQSVPVVISQDEQLNKEETDDNTIYTKVEVKASYPGGDNALRRDLASRILYPKQAIENGEYGRVVVEFVVEKDGSLSDFNILRHASDLLDSEALRVVQTFKFIPAVHEGKVVRSRYVLQVSFNLQ